MRRSPAARLLRRVPSRLRACLKNSLRRRPLRHYLFAIFKKRSSLSFSFSTFIPKSSRVAGICDSLRRLTNIMAFTGQAATQSPQPIHCSTSTTATSFPISIADTGHLSSAHTRHPVHTLLSTSDWNPLVAKPWARLSLVRLVRIMQQQGQQLQMKLALSALLLLV